MRSSVARRPRRIVRVIGPVSALILAGAATTAQAQAVPRQPPPPNSPAPASQPPAPGTTSAPITTGQPGAARLRPVTDVPPIEAAPVLTFGADGVSLEEALRLTLRHDSTIQLSAADADRLAGFAQEQAGIFDTAITGGVEYSYRVQELTESRKEDERNKRRKLDDFINTAGPDVAATRSTVNLLQQILSLPPGNEQAQVDQLAAVSPNLGSQLKVLNALIAGNPSQAAQLRQIRTDFLNAAFAGFNDSLTQQEKSLRIARLNREDLGDAPDDEVFQNTRAKVQFSKLFRTGIQVAPFVDFTAEGSNFKGKERKAEFGGKGLNDLYTTRIGSDFLLPLLRGRGGEAIAAGERAATIEAQAGTLEVEHQRAAASGARRRPTGSCARPRNRSPSSSARRPGRATC